MDNVIILLWVVSLFCVAVAGGVVGSALCERRSKAGLSDAEVIQGLLDQAEDKEELAAADGPDSIFARDAAVLRAAADKIAGGRLR